MERKVRFFRNIVANLALSAVVLAVLVFTLVDNILPVAAEEKPVFKGDSQTSVSLMVNVYWGTEYLDDMLRIFEENNVKTTFFVGGLWAAENSGSLKKINEKGHEIGNHGYFHKDHQKLPAQRNKEEINVTHQLIKSLIAVEMNLFSPPSGSFNTVTLESAKELGYTTIMYTTDTLDWRDKDADLIYSRAVTNISAGDFILIHPTQATVDALPRIIKTIKNSGLTVTTVSSVLK